MINHKSQGFGSVSRVLFPSDDGRRSFLWTSRCRLALPPWREATYPPAERPKPLAPGPGAAFADRLLGLAGGGVFPAGDVTAAAVRSYRTISPLPEPHPPRRCASGEAIGRVFSVALSLGPPDFTARAPKRELMRLRSQSLVHESRFPVAVSHHRALSCSDFPPRTAPGDPERPPEPTLGIHDLLLTIYRAPTAILLHPAPYCTTKYARGWFARTHGAGCGGEARAPGGSGPRAGASVRPEGSKPEGRHKTWRTNKIGKGRGRAVPAENGSEGESG